MRPAIQESVLLPVTLPPEPAPREAPGPARDELDVKVAVLYSSLKELARRATRGRAGRQLITPTDLVHESYLRLAKNQALGRLRRTEFLALAATVIRHVLVDRARELEALKRGARFRRLTLDGRSIASAAPLDLLVLDEALKKLAALDSRQARIVELKFFGGLEIDEIAQTLKVSPRTIDGDWHMARAWLHRELSRVD